MYLVGFDSQELACDPTVDYVKALDLFVRYRVNKVRVWIYCWFGTTSFHALTPWATDGTGRHNLDRWNPAYWSRVRDFVRKARERSIVVEITIFAPYPAARRWWSDGTHRVAWNKAHNGNQVFSSNSRGHFQPEFFDLAHAERSSSGKTLADYQRSLVDKVMAELGAFGNVYFEVCNEFGANRLDVDRWHPWQLRWGQRIDGATPRLVAVHAGFDRQVKAPLYWEKEYVDVLNFRSTASPQGMSDMLHPAQTKGKVLSINESTSGDFHDSPRNLNNAMRVAWGIFLSGGHFALYEDDSSRIGNARWIEAAKRLKAMRDIAESIPFWELSPVDQEGREYDTLVSEGPSGSNRQLLAKPGATYLAYFWGRKSTTGVAIRLPSSAFAYTWYDPRDARVLTTGAVTSSGTAHVPSPPPASWDEEAGLVLVIRKR
ncbi:MAG: hypothetical protein ACRDF5_01160 [bacterium]